jgi:hypothetical protein
MTLNNALRNAFADVLNSSFGGGVLEIYTGASPGAGNTATGTLLASITLPATPFSNSNGVATKSGTWQDASANAAGTAGYARIRNSGDTLRMDISIGEGSGELSLDNTDIASGQVVTVTGGSITFPGS